MATPTAMHHSHLALQTVVSTSVPEGQHTGLEQRLAQASLRRVEAKEFVFAEGDPTTHIFQVETGAVALYKVLCDGRRQVVGFAYPGDLIGLGAEGEHVMNAQAIKPTRLRCLPVASLNQIARSGSAAGLQALRGAGARAGGHARSPAHHRPAQRDRARRIVPAGLLAPQRAQRAGPVHVRSAHDARRHRRLPGPHHRDREPHLHQAQGAWASSSCPRAAPCTSRTSTGCAASPAVRTYSEPRRKFPLPAERCGEAKPHLIRVQVTVRHSTAATQPDRSRASLLLTVIVPE